MLYRSDNNSRYVQHNIYKSYIITKYSQTTNIYKESAKLSYEKVEIDVEKAKSFTAIYLWKLLENRSKSEHMFEKVCSK